MSPRLELPTLQNWSCHSCSGCCRQHAIEVTDEERSRIEGQNWTAADGVPAGQPVIVRMSGRPWDQRRRLANRPDGACVFLDERGLCRIHAKFGEAAKPLACRIYPYAFHPNGRGVTVSLRFSCPSVVANRGRPVAEQARELREIAAAVVPADVTRIPPPEVSPGVRVDWPDLQRFVQALDRTFDDPQTPTLVKLLRVLTWIGYVEQAKFDKVQGPRLDEFLDLIAEAAAAELPADSSQLGEPSAVGRQQFRLLVAQYARKDTVADLSSGLAGRWKLLRAALRFARGRGNTVALQDDLPAVPFAVLERPLGGVPAESEAILTRYFRVKIRGLHFCGLAYYGVPLVEGFRSLALMLPVTLTISRWIAAGQGRDAVTADDVSRALAIADHQHGYAEALGGWSARRRARMLSKLDDVRKLCAWTAR